MIARRTCILASILSLAVVAAGCGTSAPSRFYTLDSTAIPGVALSTPTTVMVGAVSVPGVVDQPQFVVQVAPNRVEVDEFNRWAAPLNESIARAVAGDLAVQLDTSDVATAMLANFNPSYVITIEVQRFESIRGQTVLVEAVWAVRKSATAETRSGRTIAREAVQGDSYDALAAAHSRALATVSGDIAAMIRSEASEKL